MPPCLETNSGHERCMFFSVSTPLLDFYQDSFSGGRRSSISTLSTSIPKMMRQVEGPSTCDRKWVFLSQHKSQEPSVNFCHRSGIWAAQWMLISTSYPCNWTPFSACSTGEHLIATQATDKVVSMRTMSFHCISRQSSGCTGVILKPDCIPIFLSKAPHTLLVMTAATFVHVRYFSGAQLCTDKSCLAFWDNSKRGTL